jgi:hypothetical protein
MHRPLSQGDASRRHIHIIGTARIAWAFDCHTGEYFAWAYDRTCHARNALLFKTRQLEHSYARICLSSYALKDEFVGDHEYACMHDLMMHLRDETQATYSNVHDVFDT